MAADATATGRKVLAGLEKGRAEAIRQAKARARELSALVIDMACADADAGRGPWGRAGRIQRKLRRARVDVSERHVRRILSDTHSSASDFSGYGGSG